MWDSMDGLWSSTTIEGSLRGVRQDPSLLQKLSHFDHDISRECTLEGTQWVGSRDVQNYCEDFEMTDSVRKEKEEKVSKAQSAFQSLWEK